MPVAHRNADVGQHADNLLLELPQLLRIGFLVESDPDERLRLRPFVAAATNRFEAPLAVAPDMDDRVYRDVHGEIVPRQRHRYRIHQERHVVINHLDEGKIRDVTVFFFGRVKNPDQRLAAAPPGTKLQVRERNPRHDRFGTALQVLDRNMGKILRQESFDLYACTEGRRGCAGSNDGFDDAVPGVAPTP